MPLRFTLINTVTGESTFIDEPIGMDKVSLHIKRDENFHGFLDAIDDSLGSFQFYGLAYNILKQAFHTDGVDADVRLVIDYQCTDDTLYDNIYKGKFSFDQYKEIRGSSGCYIECPIQNGNDLQTFRSRMNQKVSLDSLRTFDSISDSIVSYSQLGKEIKLNPKSVRYINYATIGTTSDGSKSFTAAEKHADGSNFVDSSSEIQTWGPSYPAFANPSDNVADNTKNEFTILDDNPHTVIPFTTIRSAEFGNFPGGVGDEYFGEYLNLDNTNEIFQYTPEIPYEKNEIQIDIDISGAVFMPPQIWPFMDHVNGVSVQYILLKGLTWEDAKSHHTTPYAPGVRGCTLDWGYLDLYDHATTVSPASHGVTLYDYVLHHDAPWTTSPTVDYRTFRYYHTQKNVQFYPGEKLFLAFIIGKDPDPHLHTAFFSVNYTYRDTYYFQPGSAPRTVDWTSPQTYSQRVEAPQITVDGTLIDPPSESYIRLTFTSGYKTTTAPCYLINESLSRAVELTTNDAMRVYSDYFGRAGAHESKPYAPATTGAGGLTALTNGLLLRGSSPIQTWHMGYSQFVTNSKTVNNYTLDSAHDQPTAGLILHMDASGANTVMIPSDTTDPGFHIGAQIIIQQNGGLVTIQPETGVSLAAPGGSTTTTGPGSQILLTKVGANSWLLAGHAPMFVSFQEMIEALNAIHAVGFGLEHDAIRTDFTDRFFVRVEPIRYFYDHSLTLMTCDNVESIETDASAGDAISIFKTGYTKWEAEQANGLDEFLSHREYRTTLRTMRKTLDRQCKYIASGYAIEVTRRKLGTNTTDWRYDNDTFIICLEENVIKDGETAPFPDYMSETDSVSGATGLLDATTVYNYRISPARNALRWLPYILSSYADWENGQLIFTSGDGNYTAQGSLTNNPVEAYSLNESSPLSWQSLAYHILFPPVYRNEVVKFKYPMSYDQWRYINTGNNKYGKIRYNVNDSAYEEGYILDLKYDLFGGMAEFTLRPAI